MNGVILLTGSNLGDRRALLQEALERITQSIGPLVRVSGIYETEAWGIRDQGPFLNQVLEVQTVLSPEAVLENLLCIEDSLGRRRREKWGPREIDIDILFYRDRIIEREDLRVPHPEIPNRRFVLEPLHEIAPGLVHPLLGLTVAELLARTQDSLTVRRLQ
jgi:2-amino-4-hydroxy-6-hydroxymethyldihydropteridine diphosphokinase